jgi:hypothetical protein
MNLSLTQIIQLVAKYAPVVIGIVQREGPAIQAFLEDLKSISAGQPPSAVVPAQGPAPKTALTGQQ